MAEGDFKMKAIEQIGGAITILNAVATGKGAAAGIATYSKVKVEPAKGVIFDISPAYSDGRLLEACLTLFQEITDIIPENLKITTESPFPPERGLKTSSAISTGVFLALSNYYGVKMDVLKALEYSAQASVNAGVSITGAYDDAAACYFGGIAFTDNTKKEILGLYNSPKGFDVILLIPAEKLSKKEVNIEKIDKEILKEALDAFENKRIFEAIYYNTIAYAPLLHPHFEHIERLEELGAEIVGMNGTGPSLFAIIKPSLSSEFIETVERTGHYETIKTKFRPLSHKGLEVFYNVNRE